jgi:hypothetical protein
VAAVALASEVYNSLKTFMKGDENMFVKVEFSHSMLVVDSKSIVAAVHYATKEYGVSQAPYLGQRATEEDIEWFKAMGGKIQKIE